MLTAVGSRRDFARLAIVVTVSTVTMTPSDTQLLISSHAGVRWYSCSACRTSFTPMKPRITARP